MMLIMYDAFSDGKVNRSFEPSKKKLLKQAEKDTAEIFLNIKRSTIAFFFFFLNHGPNSAIAFHPNFTMKYLFLSGISILTKIFYRRDNF